MLIVIAWIGTRALAAPDAIDAVVRVGMTVEDAVRSIAFYSDVLGFEKAGDVEIAGKRYEQLTGVFGLRARVVTMKLGEEEIELTEYLTSGGRPVPVDSRSNDLWFQHVAIITNDMDAAYAKLREHKVKHGSTGPQKLPEWNKNAAGIRAFYFLDPDRHVLEVLQFPPGKGDPKWQPRTASEQQPLFLGIDHTAIVVSNTEKSLAFYRDTLSMKVAGGSENYGDEQEHLNNVRGAKLRITTLRASRGPAIEFLEYVSPGVGRPFPADAAANDLFHWQTVLHVNGPAAGLSDLARGGGRMVSDGAVTLPDAKLGFQRGLMARDPDGHAVVIVSDR